MRRTNINAVMRMVKRYLSGEMDAISFKLDFPYEVTRRYQSMNREDPEYSKRQINRDEEKENRAEWSQENHPAR